MNKEILLTNMKTLICYQLKPWWLHCCRSNASPVCPGVTHAPVVFEQSDAHVLNSELGWCQQTAIWCPRSQLWTGLVSADGNLMPTCSIMNWTGVSRRHSDANVPNSELGWCQQTAICVPNSELGWCQQTAIWCPRSQLWTGAGVSRRQSDAHVLNSEMGWYQQTAICVPNSELGWCQQTEDFLVRFFRKGPASSSEAVGRRVWSLKQATLHVQLY